MLQKNIYQGTGPQASLSSKPGEPLRIRIPRYIICGNCEQIKILKKDELSPIGWRCDECYTKYACEVY